MKKIFRIFLILIFILIYISANISYARYKKTLKGSDVTITSQSSTPLTATIAVENEDENTYSVTVTNNNPYAVKYKIKDADDTLNVKYGDTEDEYVTIPANTTQTSSVKFSSKSDLIYKDAQKDSSDNIYMNINIEMQGIKPYMLSELQIATNTKVYIEKNLKNNVVSGGETDTEYSEGSQFSGTSGSSDKELGSVTDTETGGTIYFYRGAVTDNYVSFAGKTWRILRINADGTLRIVLDSVATTSQYQTSNTATSIDTAITLIDWQSSSAYTALHNWYNTNIATNYSNYVVQSNFVFDTSYSDKTNSTGGGGACYYFGTYQRVGKDVGNYTPTFSETDKNVITDYVGLLTGDDIVYAGGHWESSNTSYFLYNSSITTDCWTMSPSFWDNNSHKKAGMMILATNGRLHDWPSNGNTLTSTLGIRPVITIRGDLEMTGTGTSSDPYKYK